MKRIAENELGAWKDRADRKPLIVRGARQVGKTYLVEAFGKASFPSVLTVNLEQKEDLHSLFTRMEAARIIQDHLRFASAQSAGHATSPKLQPRDDGLQRMARSTVPEGFR